MTGVTESERQSLDEYVHKVYGTDYQIVGAAQVLWPPAPGLIAGSKAVLVALLDGRRVWGVVHGLAIPPDRIAPMMRQRVSAYRDAIAETEALLMMAGGR